ncbi:hypothetical protein [Arthrobacter sp. NIO-1057]|uniref:hypothetical protein n=1 Tax=Arthrobacter sp. NIO-1057 TaxID=993071 RepID=UPI00071CFF63|nr:hypothetical protein [Arthrobacter sp. NIO-1057]KSU67852.1 hypothetical protein AS038_01795 [Arthrobacter sp. NIO-1057]SCB81111.1 hypothetical protein GA0061084_0366 [Arthrobacter sp. NIO-1057]
MNTASPKAPYPADFVENATRCSEQGGGFTEFLGSSDVVRLQWPTDFVEQWLYDHAGNRKFLTDYGHVDLTQIDCRVETLSVKLLIEIPRDQPEFNQRPTSHLI